MGQSEAASLNKILLTLFQVFSYNGADCSIRQKYICEHEENTTERALSRIHKSLSLKEGI